MHIFRLKLHHFLEVNFHFVLLTGAIFANDDRMIRFGEAYYNTRTRDYDLTAGEIEINDSDKDKSSGVLLPAAQLIINKEGQLEFQLYQNPWKLTNIIDWHKAGVPD